MKIIKFVATSCQILRLKCTNFGKGGEEKGRGGGMGRGKGGEGRGKGEKGRGRGGEEDGKERGREPPLLADYFNHCWGYRSSCLYSCAVS